MIAGNARLLAILMALVSLLATPRLLAQSHKPYKLYDLGTFGGPSSGVGFQVVSVTERGKVVGGAETSTANPDQANPNPIFGPSDFVVHAFEWQHGSLKDLGTLPGGNNSAATWVNEAGTVAGISDNGVIDPQVGFPQAFAVVWSHGHLQNLGTLGGNQSFATAMNNRGQVTGIAENDVPDPFSLYGPGGTETRAFLWERGVMQDLGTLGGPDSFAQYVNDKGQVAGFSFTSDLNVDPFLWRNGTITDLGSFGGTFGQVGALNNRGQVVGLMNLAGDVNAHPFLWDRGKLTDLGTFGGDFGQAIWMNEAGEVIGEADYPIPCTPDCGHPQVYRPFLWRHGVMTDLGAAPGDRCGFAYGINASTQIVGASGVCHGGVDAFLWENGAIYNLNDLIPSNSPLHLVYGLDISDRGEITGLGVPPGVSVYDVETLGHAFLLVPCEEGECSGDDSNWVPRQSVFSLAPAANQTSMQRNRGEFDMREPVANRLRGLRSRQRR
jgi:probable HAF family extracellular repeat protein